MKRYAKNLQRGLAAAAVGVVTLTLAGPAFAADTQVSNRETVLVELSSTGKVQHARLFSQLAVTGNGTVTILDPISTRNLRNLNGFGAPSVQNGQAKFTLSTSGSSDARTVSDFDAEKLPVTVGVEYKLNGKSIKPGDLVGKKGVVEVTYHVQNVSAAPTDIAYKDGHGNTINETIDLVTPFVGQLTTVLPKNFTEIDSPRADEAGDGKGGTQLAWTMVLFSPIGQTDQTFGWKANVKDAIAPSALVQIVPVPPARKPELKFGQDGFDQGAATGATLTAGATLIDSNLIKLRDGASDLLTGLAQLQSGAVQLKDGLAGQALPGAQKLSNGLDQASGGADLLAEGLKKAGPGASELSSGITQAHSGSGRLSSGLQQLKGGTSALSEGFHSTTGAPDLIGGSQDLASALGLISGGLAQLAGSSGIPAAKAGALALKAGVDQILAGIGSAGQPSTILGGLAALSTGAGALHAGAQQLQDGLDALASPSTGLPAAKGGVDQVKAGLDAAVAPTSAALSQLATAVGTAKALPSCAGDAVCSGTLQGVLDGLGQFATNLSTQIGQASGGLAQVSGGLGQAIAGLGAPGTPGTLRDGIAQIVVGLAQAQAGLGQVTAGVDQVRLGLKSGNPAHPGISEGLDTLVAGLTAAVDGLGQLAPGAALANTGAGLLSQKIAEAGDGAAQIAAGTSDAAAGAGTLNSGLGKLDAGGKELAGGLGAAVSGSSELSTGIHQLNAGGKQLADGLTSAADGSSQLADGAGKAHDGAGQIVAGAGQLQSEGTSQLVKAGNDTTKQFGREAAIMTALNAKAADGGLPYGPPAGATGSAAYSYELASSTGEGGRDATRAILALGLFALAGLVGTVLHRRFA